MVCLFVSVCVYVCARACVDESQVAFWLIQQSLLEAEIEAKMAQEFQPVADS